MRIVADEFTDAVGFDFTKYMHHVLFLKPTNDGSDMTCVGMCYDKQIMNHNIMFGRGSM